MSEYYNLDAIKTAMQKDIAIHSAYLESWKKVTFPTKKDGKPFANMSKNIDGAKYTAESYAMQAGEYELTVYSWCNAAGYIYDTIKVYDLVCYLKDETKKAKTQNYMPENYGMNQVYKYDLDDIRQAVKSRVEYLESYIADLRMQLASADKVFKAFRDAYSAAMKTLENETSEFSHKDLYYAVRDCVKSRYPYC